VIRFDIASLAQRYAQEQLAPHEVVREALQRIEACDDGAIWLAVKPARQLLEEADGLLARQRSGEDLPLFGLPFGVKDNVDVAGLPTTAACPAFAYTPTRSAAVVQTLEAAGALCLGKQNMDQFATGLVGTRNLGGRHCRNARFPDHVPGGSSSGSAVAVARGHCSFSIGSDTGGSGRVPAACNDVVGLKPTPGLLDTRGMVYCNRSFDVPPVFALNVDDAWRVLRVLADAPNGDLYQSRRSAGFSAAPGELPKHWRFALPLAHQREFFGDAAARRAFEQQCAGLQDLGGEPVEVDWAPFAEAGRMVFDSALIGERWWTYGPTIERSGEQVHPVVRQAIDAARHCSAADAFDALYRLRALQQQVRSLFDTFDILVTPTIGTLPTLTEVDADPAGVNKRMGHYTYHANPLRLAAVSVPGLRRDDGLPASLLLTGPSFSESKLGAFALAFERHQRLAA